MGNFFELHCIFTFIFYCILFYRWFYIAPCFYIFRTIVTVFFTDLNKYFQLIFNLDYNNKEENALPTKQLLPNSIFTCRNFGLFWDSHACVGYYWTQVKKKKNGRGLFWR